MDAFDRLRDGVARLRGEGGRDGDRALPTRALRLHLLEATHEVVEASHGGAPGPLRDALGDLLLAALRIARRHEARGDFTLDEVLGAVADERAPRTALAPERLDGEAPEAAARPADASALDGVPRALPALVRAWRVGSRAARVGFDWPDVAGVRAKVDEELAELDAAAAAGSADAVEDELGDLLFSVVNLARFLGAPPEDALRRATTKFERRFRAVEAACLADGRTVLTTDPDTLERYWARAKETAG